MNDDGMALRAALDVQWSLHCKKASLMIERSYLRSIDESSRASVGNDGAIEIYRLEPDSGTLTLGEGAPLKPAVPFSIFLAERR